MPKYQFLHQLADVKLTGAETRGQIGVVLVDSPGGPAAPLHVHRTHDETFHVVEGELTLFVGDEVVRAGAGATVVAPRDVPHTLTIDSPSAQFVVVSTPAGFEAFVAEVGTPEGEEPVPVDPEQLGAIATRHGIEILGPPMPATGAA
jgi:quercetin dioxygenase-like cupin family protein